ncbi:phosphopantetheine-binding protein [Paenibacillus sp. SYP-B4298]|uniref:phosphopantetheine-binding protein n=1 Tax=Paenibacillus sp. SYP-B4298 TaxID=2996034 RepID=UPI0022DD6C2C|nr:phosphopantetheine-binding protein [Paenibacillus sp. SYP-B4298]
MTEEHILTAIQESVLSVIGGSDAETRIDWLDPLLFENLAIDSTAMIEFLMLLEQKLAISFRLEEISPEDFVNVSTLTQMLLRM